jgi:putative Holliday junction resolvase
MRINRIVIMAPTKVNVGIDCGRNQVLSFRAKREISGKGCAMDKPIPDLKGQKILAVDYGTKTTGLAIYAPGDPYPRPYDTVPYKNDDQLIEAIKQTVNDEGASVVVLGMPRFLDGKPSTMTARVEEFSAKLEKILAPLPLVEQDEALSSTEARERMLKSPRYNFKVDPAKIDELAAAIILEDFLAEHQS